MAFLVTAYGVTIQTAAEIAEELANDIRTATGNASLPFTGDTLLGQVNEAVADRLASYQELFQGITTIWRVSKASGVWLSELVQIGGLTRKAATHSLAQDVLIAGTTGTVAPAGMLIGIPNLEPRFQLSADIVLTPATAWAQSTAYVVGDVRAANGQIWFCNTAGTSASGGTGPSGTVPIYDGTCRWLWVGAGDGRAYVNATAVDTGPVAAAQYGLAIIVTPKAGITGCLNPEAARPGAYEETDAQLRLRYAQSYHLPGSATANAIRADVLAVEGVQEATIYSNSTPSYGGNGIPGQPPGNVWAIVKGSMTDTAVADALFGSVADGIGIGWSAAPGAIGVPVTDSQGVTTTIYYSQPSPAVVDVNVSIVYGSNTGPASVATDIAAALDTLQIGADVINWRVQKVAGDAMIAAGYDPESITSIVVQMRIAPASFSTANVPIAYYQQAQAGTIAVTFS